MGTCWVQRWRQPRHTHQARGIPGSRAQREHTSADSKTGYVLLRKLVFSFEMYVLTLESDHATLALPVVNGECMRPSHLRVTSLIFNYMYLFEMLTGRYCCWFKRWRCGLSGGRLLLLPSVWWRQHSWGHHQSIQSQRRRLADWNELFYRCWQ